MEPLLLFILTTVVTQGYSWQESNCTATNPQESCDSDTIDCCYSHLMAAPRMFVCRAGQLCFDKIGVSLLSRQCETMQPSQLARKMAEFRRACVVDDAGTPADCRIYDVCVSGTQFQFSAPDAPCVPGKYSKLLGDFITCISEVECGTNKPSLFINEMKKKATACGDTLPNLPEIYNSGTNTGTGGTSGTNSNTNGNSGTNSNGGNNGAIPCDRLAVNSCLKTANDSIFLGTSPGQRCSVAEGQKLILEYCLRSSGFFNCPTDESLTIYNLAVSQNLNNACTAMDRIDCSRVDEAWYKLNVTLEQSTTVNMRALDKAGYNLGEFWLPDFSLDQGEHICRMIEASMLEAINKVRHCQTMLRQMTVSANQNPVKFPESNHHHPLSQRLLELCGTDISEVVRGTLTVPNGNTSSNNNNNGSNIGNNPNPENPGSSGTGNNVQPSSSNNSGTKPSSGIAFVFLTLLLATFLF